MKDCKQIFFDNYTTIGSILRQTDLSLFEANVLQVSVKDNTLILKPTVSPSKAEKLAKDFILNQILMGNPDFEVNSRQRVVACAIRGHVGVAYCSKEDTFNVTIGKALALSRALHKPLPKLLQTYLDLD